ncbi:probable E3 ubiquitin-protein ligase XERICO [Gastrolobium bilobum]|uniref:probable E3 ubiquitin-protein ligase XERICO n=1 Tax=Gastrolobium bilobum TaxID=150636 RepID=UPI002AB100D3|nr:probable E3 ubiquitin-protein ligase XERICO [Gastrolobium bilobum]
MREISKLFHQLCGKIILLLACLLIELIVLIRKLTTEDTSPITTEQYLKFIEEKNPTICYTKGLRTEHVECRVCLSEFEEGDKVRNLKCKHTFHKDCLDKWLLEYWATCPLCRKKVLPDAVVSKHRQLLNQVDFNGNDEQPPFLLSVLRGDFHGNRNLSSRYS